VPDAELARLRPDRPGYEDRARALVSAHSDRFITRDLPALWPESLDRGGEFRWEDLIDWRELNGAGRGATAAELLESQHISANVNPSDRYSLCLPGTPALRISPLDPTYDNFTVCGDWTSCGLNLGCVESAVMSGRLAAHAISRSPRLEAIIGYDHP
jgi:hypothetical protein